MKVFKKTFNSGKQAPDVIFYYFSENESLCSVKTLEFYLKTTEGWRKKGDPLLLLLSFVKQLKPISSATLARCIKKMLKIEGINTVVFKAHSVRLSSTSKAKSFRFTTESF